jgi:hypothetical protein
MLTRWTICILYEWNFKSVCKMLLIDSQLNTNPLACLQADHPRLLIRASLTLVMSSGILAVHAGPGGFLFIMFQLLWNFPTHPATGNGPVLINIELSMKAAALL